MLSREQKLEYNRLILAAREAEKESPGSSKKALLLYRRAAEIFPSDSKLQKKIEFLESQKVLNSETKVSVSVEVPREDLDGLARLLDVGDSISAIMNWSPPQELPKTSSPGMPTALPTGPPLEIKAARSPSGDLQLPGGLVVPHATASRLYPYQLEGLAWMWQVFRQEEAGGILADDMGLGKTVQVGAFLESLAIHRAREWKQETHLSSPSGPALSAALRACGAPLFTVLLVMPVSLLENWATELARWAPSLRQYPLYKIKPQKREETLVRLFRTGGCCLTTYGTVACAIEHLEKAGVFSAVFLDEGHKIKNTRTKAAQALRRIRAAHRFILTGTPVQNNLMELHSLVDFVSQGTLLGPEATFKRLVQDPILKGMHRDASPSTRARGEKTASALLEVIAPFFLRREKAASPSAGPPGGDASTPPPSKEYSVDVLTCWVPLSSAQQQLYKGFLQSDAVRRALNISAYPLAAIVVLRKICSHPWLIRGPTPTDPFILDNALTVSSKLRVAVSLVCSLAAGSHRMLVFSESLQFLNLLARALEATEIKPSFDVLRLDGSLSSTERQEVVTRFQLFAEESRPALLLLTTQVGGVGLTLTAADRVILLDPSWNPANDDQAIGRADRIGQHQNIIVYRLVTIGTVEEKMYRRQISKSSLIRSTTRGKKNQSRYFSKADVRALFEIGDMEQPLTARIVETVHEAQGRPSNTTWTPTLASHVEWLQSIGIRQCTDHNKLFSMPERASQCFDLNDEQALEHLLSVGSGTTEGPPVTPKRRLPPRTPKRVRAEEQPNHIAPDLDSALLEEFAALCILPPAPSDAHELAGAFQEEHPEMDANGAPSADPAAQLEEADAVRTPVRRRRMVVDSDDDVPQSGALPMVVDLTNSPPDFPEPPPALMSRESSPDSTMARFRRSLGMSSRPSAPVGDQEDFEEDDQEEGEDDGGISATDPIRDSQPAPSTSPRESAISTSPEAPPASPPAPPVAAPVTSSVFVPMRPVGALAREERVRYNELLQQAKSLEPTHPVEALQILRAALSICDADLRLHQKVTRLAARLGQAP
ncbi:putative Protein CHROMATIN REMODELING 24 [Paratrimastix pyriformis]|uniref:Uncharacterized protein n=1 Tax=Paratrimastix pyriformis TaxID=342808 RepID=A0ABQ8UEN8_9EUKA|nr:putative Protein CHROMATIN REMODELING 24 [Paratrimastix pyriformis]